MCHGRVEARLSSYESSWLYQTYLMNRVALVGCALWHTRLYVYIR
jgi:hypothetical protein